MYFWPSCTKSYCNTRIFFDKQTYIKYLVQFFANLFSYSQQKTKCSSSSLCKLTHNLYQNNWKIAGRANSSWQKRWISECWESGNHGKIAGKHKTVCKIMQYTAPLSFVRPLLPIQKNFPTKFLWITKHKSTLAASRESVVSVQLVGQQDVKTCIVFLMASLPLKYKKTKDGPQKKIKGKVWRVFTWKLIHKTQKIVAKSVGKTPK